MTNFFLVALALGLALLTGCTGKSDDSSDNADSAQGE